MTDTGGLDGWTHVYSGKVRDLYVPTALMTDDDSWTGDPLQLSPVVLVVASDRVSAFDRVLDPAILGKGALLTSLSRWWFDRLPEVPNHLAYAEDDRYHDLPRSRARSRTGRCSAAPSTCSRSSASCAATSPAAATRSTPRRARSAASRCRRA
ncbi:hypothetical protein GCM10025870_22030 [Agromyces marinus]|uniref:phosphoribosylaminoimidazolesuccinocarboxamide synthase n=1 Tax=Agromyces marinus TaxID=1389020 RepID=A0ABM8H2V9_9MICO|nr:hypothetical protein GCM10025870_22030 [Agromyces marinus]